MMGRAKAVTSDGVDKRRSIIVVVNRKKKKSDDVIGPKVE
jgi:hypothetical protein